MKLPEPCPLFAAAVSPLRRSELALLTWADVDLARRRLDIRQAQADEGPGENLVTV